MNNTKPNWTLTRDIDNQITSLLFDSRLNNSVTLDIETMLTIRTLALASVRNIWLVIWTDESTLNNKTNLIIIFIILKFWFINYFWSVACTKHDQCSLNRMLRIAGVLCYTNLFRLQWFLSDIPGGHCRHIRDRQNKVSVLLLV